MADKNHIFDEISGKGNEQENKLFRELLEFEKESALADKTLLPEKNNIIEFLPQESENIKRGKSLLKLAADSKGLTDEKTGKRSGFITSTDGKYAIKYSQKKDTEIHLTILTEQEHDTNDIILYSPELNKYFISNLEGDFIIGQYAVFDLNSFNFKAFLPLEKLVIIKDNKSYSIFSYNGNSKQEILEQTKSFIRLKIQSEKEIKIAAIQTVKTKDFVKMENGVIQIPLILLEDKSQILLY